MNRRNLVHSAALTATASFLVANNAQGATANDQKHYKIVIQVSDNDPAKWNLALNNAKNLQADVGASNVAVEMVAYGPGIGMLKFGATVGNRVNDAVAAGVHIVACQNTMHAQKLAKEDMNPSVGYVPAGVTEIMKKQSEGWAYLRP